MATVSTIERRGVQRHMARGCPFFALLLPLFAPFAWGGDEPAGELEFHIRTDKAVYDSKEPIGVECRITNNGDRTIFLDPIMIVNSKIYIWRKCGKYISPLGIKYFADRLAGKEDLVELPRGASYTAQYPLLRDLFNVPEEPGEYDMYMTYENHLQCTYYGVKLWEGYLTSNTVTLEITE
jgi:hypothetical protein